MRRCRSSPHRERAEKRVAAKAHGRTPLANTFMFCNTIGGIATVREDQLIVRNLCARTRYSDTGSISVGSMSGTCEARSFEEARHLICSQDRQLIGKRR